MTEKNRLFPEFPPVSTKEWTDRITADLKGEDYTKKLVWNTGEGISVMPFYRQEDIEGTRPIPLFWKAGANGNDWLIRQDIAVSDFNKANMKALDILMKGVTSLGFYIADPATVTEKTFRTLLNGIYADSVELNFFSEGRAIEIIRILALIVEEKNVPKNLVRGAVEADPLGWLFKNGKLCVGVEEGLEYLSELSKLSLIFPAFRTININGSWFSDSGADVVSELAVSLSLGNEYMSVLTGKGMSSPQAASRIRFSFGTGSNYFFEIAKLRAARLLWALVCSAYGAENVPEARMEIHSVTGRWNKTEKDPFVNLLRTQTEAMSAVLGGADSVTVEPFDRTFRTPEEFSERLARNQQLLLKEEAYFDKVIDPAKGSWYIEKITSMIAEEAWKLFIETEKQGGFISALSSGTIGDMLKRSAGKREAWLSSRHDLYGKGTEQA